MEEDRYIQGMKLLQYIQANFWNVDGHVKVTHPISVLAEELRIMSLVLPQQLAALAEVPAEFRDGGAEDGVPLCFPYLQTCEWGFQPAYVTKAFKAGKLTRRHPIRNKYAYLFTELAALRTNKTRNDDGEH